MPQQGINIRHGFGLKVVLNGLGCTWRFSQSFLIEFPNNKDICYCFCHIDFTESEGLMDLPGHDEKMMSHKKMIRKSYLLYFVFVFSITLF